MAVTISAVEHSVAGNKRVQRGKLALDTSYPSGGYPITAQQLGLSVIEFFETNPQQGYAINYDPVNRTLRVFSAAGLTVKGSQQIGDVVQVSGGVLGKTTAGDVTTIPQEVATGTDLSAVTGVLWRAEGV